MGLKPTWYEYTAEVIKSALRYLYYALWKSHTDENRSAIHDGDIVGVDETPWLLPFEVLLDGEVFEGDVKRAKLGADGWIDVIEDLEVESFRVETKRVRGHVEIRSKNFSQNADDGTSS